MLKLSIIIPTHNSGHFLEKALQSILDQTYKNIELLIVDGKSTDNTLDIISKYTSGIHFWMSEKDLSPSDAINKVLKYVTGDIITFFGADDYYIDSTAFCQIVNEFETNQRLDVLFVNNNSVERVSEGIVSTFKNDPKVFASLNSHDNSILHHITNGYLSGLAFPGLIVRNSSLSGFRFDALNVVSDYDFVLHMWRRGANFDFIENVLINVRKGGISQTEKRVLILRHIFLVNRKYFGLFMAIKFHPWLLYISFASQYLHSRGFRPLSWMRTIKSHVRIK